MITAIESRPTKTDVYTQDDIAQSVASLQEHQAVAQFHALWYHAPHTWAMTRYKGVPMLKCPMDLQVYHELIWQIQPSLIIETGTCFGGSALWFADQLDGIGLDGQVVSIDTHDKRQPDVANADNSWPDPVHPRITWIVGSSLDADVIGQVQAMVAGAHGPVMVSLDSNHRAAHVTKELDVYAPMATVGSFCVVEDTNISGRPLVCSDPGPGAAADAFIATHENFRVNPLCERYLMTMHPGGWLQRMS